MDINFQCQKCDQHMVIDESCAGFLMKCVRCGTPVTIPTPHLAGVVAAAVGSGAFLPTTSVQPAEPPPPADGIDAVQALRNAVRDRPLEEGKADRAPIWSWIVAGVAAVVVVAVGYFWFRDANPAGSQAPASPSEVVPQSLFEPSSAPPPIQPSATPPEKREATLPAGWAKAVRGVVREIQLINAVVETKIGREDYLGRLIALADQADEMLRIAEENDVLRTDANAQQFCKLASDIFFLHNQASEKWDEELTLRRQKEAFKAAHQERLAAGLQGEALQKGIAETTAVMNEITNDVMAAINARYDLWLQAQKQGEQVEPLAAKLTEPR